MTEKYIYSFSKDYLDGGAKDKDLLGGKGTNLAEMASLGISVPPGFTITTDVCRYFYSNKTYPEDLTRQIEQEIECLERQLQRTFGNTEKPLLLSVRSGAPISMPGMMDTVLNLGLNDRNVVSLAKETSNGGFAYDTYRRFLQMFGNVVLGMSHHSFEKILESEKKRHSIVLDTDFTEAHLQELVEKYKENIIKNSSLGGFPQDPKEQLKLAIDAVFSSWNSSRAVTYRKLNKIDGEMGTAVNVQSMVFGNMGESSGTGVVFTRNPVNGEKVFFGEFLMNAQGEDVVAGIRTPLQIKDMEALHPDIYKELFDISQKLENHYQDMQDLEFTIERGKLYLLQTRNGKRTGFSHVQIAVDMVEEGLINEDTAILRVDAAILPSLLANVFKDQDKEEVIKKNLVVAKGLAAGPGAASGKIVFSAEKAEALTKKGETVLLLTTETSPEDIAGMYAANGILTARGGMTSHAAVVARGMNKPCIVGCSSMEISLDTGKVRFVKLDGSIVLINELDIISLDGFTGEVLNTSLDTYPSEIEQVLIYKTKELKDSKICRSYLKLMSWSEKRAKLKVRANADTAEDARVARLYGAKGIGLCRTEHMFFDEQRLLHMRKMILAVNEAERRNALEAILPYQRDDFKAIFREMSGLPVTVRLLDPPLHEFLPNEENSICSLAFQLNKTEDFVRSRVEELKEFNPMLGHRGCRLGNTYPEITEIQVRAIIEATCDLKKEGVEVLPEIMVPLVGHYKEFCRQKEIIQMVANKVMKEKSIVIDYALGTMIEVPRAAITADKIAEHADFFSFGTNDLTQLGAGFSRDDSNSFLPFYEEIGIYPDNPFQVLDQDGIGELIKIAITKGRSINKNIKLGVCGEHGGDPQSVYFCHDIDLEYVSCSPYRIPVALLAAAQANLRK